MPKKIVWPAPAFPSTTTLNTLSSLSAETDGWNSKVNFFQFLVMPVIAVLVRSLFHEDICLETVPLLAKTVPLEDFKETVIDPENMAAFAWNEP